ncbi:chemotaxis protein CheW [Propionivibrio sp.]|uniref:chemotaxis protein CheW n=1 Tax=Propionivibrio sp. TaxID=2212460 RepID=UPI003BF3844D
MLKLTSTGDREGQVSQHDIGIMVDAVSEVLDIPGSEIEPPPSFGARIRADFIFGMGKFVIILNINEVLSVEEIAQLTGTEGALEVSVVGAA